MKTSNLFSTLSAWVLGVFLCMGLAVTAYAVDDLDLFELEGNAILDDLMGPPPDDWDILCEPDFLGGTCANTGGGSLVFTGISNDPDLTSIFTGGRKDIQDIPQWGHKDGSVPDKDDITNAYAAAYLNTMNTTEQDIGDLIIYFGMDRIDQNGDAFVGFWFFKDDVVALPDGTFDGQHTAGDILVVTNYPQSNNAVPIIKVIEWDPTCARAASNDPQPGECGATNLRLVTSDEGADAQCAPGGIDQLACAISNTEADSGGTNDPTPSPWDYESKDGDIDQFPGETFLEGGINVTQLFEGDSGCFNSFMAETRSSSSFTASLKDFRLDSFELCNATLETEIHEHPGHSPNLDGETVDVGITIHDAAFLAISGPPGAPTPTGTITFVRYPNQTCTGDIFTTLTPIDVSTGTEIMGEIRVEAPSETPAGATVLSYLVTYSGDENYPEVTAECETLQVNLFDSTITTNIHSGDGGASHDDTTDIQGGSVVATTLIHDLANVTGDGPKPTGTVTFQFYTDDSCTTEDTTKGSTGNLTTGTEAGDITDGRKVASANFSTTGYATTVAGTSLSYKASYGGDSNYKPSTDVICEKLLVRKLQPTIATNIHAGSPDVSHTSSSPTDIQGGNVFIGSTVHDLATVDGSESFLPTGDVVFTLYGDTECNSGLGETSTNALGTDIDADSRTVESNTKTFLAGYIPTADNSRGFGYMASYAGDDVYVAATDSSCEPLTVNKYVPTVATNIHPDTPNVLHTSSVPTDIQGGFVTIGDLVHDFATVAGAGGGVQRPMGVVTFERFDNGTCMGLAASTESPALTASGSDSKAETAVFDTALYVVSPATTKSLSYQASYGGDDFYTAATDSSCETLEVQKRLPSIVTHVLVLDLAIVAGDGEGPAPAAGTHVDFNVYLGLDCVPGNLAFTDNDRDLVQENGDLVARMQVTKTHAFTQTGSADISYQATYEGDANYVGVTHACENVRTQLPGPTTGSLETNGLIM